MCDQTTRAWLFIVLAVPQQHSHPIPTHPYSGSWSTQEAGGSSVRNGSCLGLGTKPFTLVCSLAWSVQASVISRADTGGWVSQQQAAGAVRISPSKWELCPSTLAGRVLTSICSTLCQVFVPVLSFFCCFSQSQSRDSRVRLFEESLTCMFSRFEKDPWQHLVIVLLCWWLKICCK